MRSRDSVSLRSGRRRSAAASCWFPLRPGTASRHSSRSGAPSIRVRAGWVQLARGDNDPVVLLARIVAALERTGPLRGDLLEELSRRTPRIVEAALPLLAADLSERDPFLLVLDDVDLITARRSRSILAFLAEQVPAGSQLVLITRGDPGMRRGRLRAGGDLTEIGTQLLALDSEETRAVAALGGLELSEKEAEALRERTEGWAAGVALAALSSRDRDDAAATRRRSGRHAAPDRGLPPR